MLAGRARARRGRVSGLPARYGKAKLPKKKPGNLLIGTWNVAVFGDLTEKWVTEPGDEPKRNLSDVCAIPEVVSRFDVCAIQETRRDLTGLQTLMKILGDDWAYVVTDVTDGGPGNGERLAFVHDRRRARSSGLGEIVVPATAEGVLIGALDRQFARTPYAVSFAAGDRSRSSRSTPCTARAGPRRSAAATSSRRSPSGSPIAPTTTREALTLDYTTAGYVPWTDYILKDSPTGDDRNAHISDHYPLWAEFAR